MKRKKPEVYGTGIIEEIIREIRVQNKESAQG